MKFTRLAKKVGIYFIGNLSTKLLSAVVVFIYAFYINAEDLGRYEYIQTLENIIIPIAFISIWEAILKYTLATQNDKEKEKVINTSAIFSIVVSLLIAIVGTIYYSIFKKEQYAVYIILMYIFYGLSTVWQYYARCLNKTKIYVQSSIIGAATNLIITAILICILKLKIEALFTANIFSNFMILSLIECKIKILRKVNIKQFNLKLLKKMLIFSVPLVINDISLWLITGFGKTIIQNVLGASANGMYAFANKFTIIVNFLGLILNKALTEEMLISKREKVGKQFEKIMQELTEKVLVLLILCIPIIMIFYNIISKTEYYQSKIYVPMLLIYSFIMLISTNLSTIFKVAEKTKYQFFTTLAGAITTVSISYLMIGKLGTIGVILGQISGSLVNVIFRYVLGKQLIELNIKWKKNIFILIIYSIVSLISVNVDWRLNSAIEIAIIIMVLVVYNRELKYIIKKLSFDRIR